MRLKIAVPEPHVTAPVLDAGLEAVTRLNEQMITQGEVPTFERALRYGIAWRPEPPGEEHFDSAQTVMKRKAGDCDDLAPFHAASLRVTGEDPGARAIVRRSGPKRWHAVVQRSDGSIDDPSLRAGMAAGIPAMTPEMMAVQGAVLPWMLQPQSSVVGAFIVRPQIALRPVYGQHQARADLPWNWTEHSARDEPTPMNYAMTALHTAPVASTALAGAITDVCHLAMAQGEHYDPDHIDRLCALADACEGMSYPELAALYGPEHAQAATQVVGSFFGKIARGLGKVARGAISFVPGVGPIAANALDAGSALLHHHHHESPEHGALPTPPTSLPLAPPRGAPAPGIYPHPGLATVIPSAPHEPTSGRDIHIHVH